MRSVLVIALLAGLSSAQAPEPLMTVKAIEVVAVSEAEEQVLRTRLPFQAGEVIDRAKLGAAAKAVRELDPYLTFKFAATGDDPSELTIRITGLSDRPSTVYIQEPEVIQSVKPEYTESMRERGVTGWVELTATIGTDGRVRDVEVFSGDPELAESGRKALIQWRYRPAYADAQPIEVRRTIRVDIPTPSGVARSKQ